MDLSDPRPVARIEHGRIATPERSGADAWKRSAFLSRRFVVGSLLVFGILVVNASFSYRTITNLIESSRTVDNTLKFVANLKAIQEKLGNSETELRGYIISGERDRLIQAQDFLGSAGNLVRALRSLSSALPEQARQVESLEGLIDREVDRLGTLIDIHDRKGLREAIRAIRATAGESSTHSIELLTADLLAAGDERLRRRSEQSMSSSGFSIVTAAVATLLNLGLLGVVILLARREIRERQQAEEVVRFAATHDPLTGLPNRALLAERGAQALAAAKSEGHSIAVLFVDLDRFKNLNDAMGHDVGDRLLQHVAGRLARCVRRSDTVARQGGDEFVVLIEAFKDLADVANVAEKILVRLAEPMTVYGKEFMITASIGISASTSPAGDEDMRTLLKNADSAMYKAKQQGNAYQFYADQMNLHSVERVELEAALRHALERQELTLHYQPKVQSRTGRVTGIESLLRWQHPTLGAIPADQLVSLAEETGMIVPIGKWALRTACLQARQWAEQGLPRFLMSVNLSARQFMSPTLLEDIVATLEETDMDPRLIELEVTESVMIREPEEAVRLLRRLKEIGLQLTIDDFGTGYSSLAYLKNLPIDCVKIDASFVRGIPMDASDVAITDTILAMAGSLGLKVVAEGVETQDQMRFLERRGCDEMQGYYFSKPLPAGQLPDYVRDRRVVPGEGKLRDIKLVAGAERRVAR